MANLPLELASLIARSRVSQPFNESPPLLSTKFDWNEGQRAAIDRIVEWRTQRNSRVLALTGAAGTGKTTVMQAVRARLIGTRTAWSAMTGKAATRMRDASGVAARTLHSVLYQPPREVDNPIDQKIDLEFERVKPDGRSCLLVVDEASMIGPRLRADIERSAYDKILIVGDPYQIPPVLSKKEEEGRGSDYSVFADVDTAHLSEVMRASGAVLGAATHVRERQEIPTISFEEGGSCYDYASCGGYDVAVRHAVERWLNDRDDHVLITFRNETRMQANRMIRARLGHISELPESGEPMVVRRNVYGADLMNGDFVHLEEWLEPGPTLVGIETRYATVRAAGKKVQLLVTVGKFDGVLPYVGLYAWKQAIEKANVSEPVPLTFGYCLTGHLAQGSEYRRVTTFLPGDLSNDHFKKPTTLPTGETMSFAMRFLYTSLARARKHTSLIVS